MPIIDLAREPSISDLTVSICIVGSGPGGGFLAAELARAFDGVAVVEAGGGHAEIDTRESVSTVATPRGALTNLGFSEQLGGTSDVWSGRLAILEAVDFAARSWVPHSGWPFGSEVLAPYYEKAATILGLKGLAEFESDHSDLGPAFAGLVAGGDIALKPFVWLDPPFRVGSYLDEIAARSTHNLTLITSARVRSLHERNGSRVIEYANVAAPDGHTIRVYARVFVLAAGGIGTPRILLNSTNRSPNGIGNSNDLVGRFLCTHPKANLGIVTLERGVSTASPLFEKRRNGVGLRRLGLGLSAATQGACAGLNHYVQLTHEPRRETSDAASGGDAEDSLTGRTPEEAPLPPGFVARFGRFFRSQLARRAALRPDGRRFVLRAFLDQFPNPDNRVSLAPDVDRHGDRKVHISWNFTDADRRTVREFFSQLQRELEHRRVGRVEIDPALANGDWPLVGIHSHLMGTTRMGDSARSGVVDRNCRVFACENLYIAGPSTFPTSGYANPFLTIAALSLRLADHLKQSIEKR